MCHESFALKAMKHEMSLCHSIVSYSFHMFVDQIFVKKKCAFKL